MFDHCLQQSVKIKKHAKKTAKASDEKTDKTQVEHSANETGEKVMSV